MGWYKMKAPYFTAHKFLEVNTFLAKTKNNKRIIFKFHFYFLSLKERENIFIRRSLKSFILIFSCGTLVELLIVGLTKYLSSTT